MVYVVLYTYIFKQSQQLKLLILRTRDKWNHVQKTKEKRK